MMTSSAQRLCYIEDQGGEYSREHVKSCYMYYVLTYPVILVRKGSVNFITGLTNPA